MKITLKQVFVCLLLWMVVAILIDHFIIQPWLPLLSSGASLKLQFKWPLGYINVPEVGFFMLVGIPLLLAALRFVPWRPPRNKQRWINGFENWSRILIWLIVVIVMTAVGQVLYLALKPILPEGIRNVVESFQLVANIGFGEFQFAEISGSLTAMCGLILGIYLFMKKGITQTLNSSSDPQTGMRAGSSGR